jgi:apoptosis-inducing factor 3
MFASTGFISLECAAQLRHRGLAVTIATDGPQPMYRILGHAAGDLARFPAPDPMDGSIRVEHWRVAEQMGRTAALNMLDQQLPFDRIPFFWTHQHGKGLKYLGHIDQWDDIRITGNLNEQEFAAFYLKNAEIKAVAAMGMGDLMEHMELCMVQNNIPSIDDIEAGTVNWEIHFG